MPYTVKEVAELSGVTIKTLHHYHKIGLLLPSRVSEAGYRLYGREELERLQEILLFRELELPLERIKELLDSRADRLSILVRQEEWLVKRRQRLDTVVQTLRNSIAAMREGKPMEEKDMFKGFANEEEWNRALSEPNDYLKTTYGAEFAPVAAEDVPGLNEQAVEAMAFMGRMAEALRAGVKVNEQELQERIHAHLEFLNRHGHPTSAGGFAAQTRFFLGDDFHLRMLEDQQTGLAYYLSAAAEAYANAHPDR